MQPDESREEKRARGRRYSNGAMAGSFAPQGLADLLRATRAGRAEIRAEWRVRPRRQRALLLGIFAVEAVLLSVVAVGFFTASTTLILGGSLTLVSLLLGTTLLTVLSELRAARRR